MDTTLESFNMMWAYVGGGVFIGILLIVMIVSRLYVRASKETAFVRTGLGGQKVILNGGAIVIPIFQEVIPVNLNTLRLDVQRAKDQALITRDRMRVDVTAEFYVRAQPLEESIANAAQTLGLKTMQPEMLKELVEGKFVDALRSVAAEMAMEELHEQRTAFVQKVQQVVTEDLLKNGLELESVSLTGLDQTSREYFNPDNAFDAEGLTFLTESIESRRKKRNDIEQDTSVEIMRKNLEAEQQRLEIQREEEYAKLQLERQIEIRRATQQSNIMTEQAERRQDAEAAQIMAQRQIDQAQIESDRIVEEERINKDRQIRELEIEKMRTIETAEITKRKSLELSEQDRAIEVADKSKMQSLAEKDADTAKAEAVRAFERVVTAREQEIAEREKMITLVEASKEAETEMIEMTVAAEAERKSAEDKADAIRTLAAAEADSEKIRALASAERYRVEADGQQALNEAANLLSNEQISMKIKMEIVSRLPEIIRESVKPMEQIDGIKIVQVEGLNGGSSGGSRVEMSEDGRSVSGKCSLADEVVNSALRYKAQAPLVESILNEVGLSGHSLDGLTDPLKS